VFQRLLVGLDGSAGAAAALEAAIALGRRSGSTIVLAVVTEIRLLEAPLFEAAGPLWTEGMPLAPIASDLREALDERAKRFLAEGVDRVTDAGLATETVRAVGIVDEELLRLAETTDAVVIGRRGELHAHPGKLGVVTAHIIKSALRPVLVAGDQPSAFERPVVAFDGGETSRHALEAAAGFAAERNLPLDVLHVADDPRDAAEVLSAATVIATARGVTPRTFALSGDIVDTVADWLTRNGGDFLIVGVHGGRGTPWPLGSHAEKLIRATVVPVLVHR
jgi:nucleotide-binding universal stress UspA family protein